MRPLVDLNGRERAILVTLVIAVFWLGLFPNGGAAQDGSGGAAVSEVGRRRPKPGSDRHGGAPLRCGPEAAR